ncbi:MAG: rod shape-determining protein RodA [Candidatus Babeliaceae bacterium]|nr:rod shape-determining protein RodA [Candidatus Babeliaceae bacterium]
MLNLDRRSLRFFDWQSLFITFILTLIGLCVVLSATYTPEEPYSLFFKKQLFGILSGFLLYILFCSVDYRILTRWGFFIYFVVIALLLFTMIKGSIGMGAQRWVSLGFIKFQPSELAKLFFPAFFVYYLTSEKKQLKTLFDFLPILITIMVSILLILKQPDLGTALIILFTGGLLLYMAGLSRKFFLIVFCICAASGPLLWHFLKPYQRQRILTFLGEGDSRKERYQIEQSCIAIGSGGLWGKGYLHGTQNRLRFLPEGRTDFIFSVLCEEFGFIGALFAITLYCLLFYRFFLLLLSLEQGLTQLLALGLMSHIIFSTIVNISMVLGLLPVVGIPLPLMSYGITHSWITLASLGWLNGIAARRF